MHEDIDDFLLKVTETEEYKDIEYLIFSIRELYLQYTASARAVSFEIPTYLEPLVEKVVELFNDSGISTVDMLSYMLNHDINNWIRYYADVFIIPCAKGKKLEAVADLNDLYALVLTAYILDLFRRRNIDIQYISAGALLTHKTNQYGLSIVNGAEFYKDFFIYEDKVYLYDILTNTETKSFGDPTPAFIRIFLDCIKNGNILMRLDDRLSLPKDQAIQYSTLNFEKYRGPQFHFKKTNLKNSKTITVHIDTATQDKLLMVIKKRYDEKRKEQFWHVEIETLPYISESFKSDHCITTFLHGMYYPDEDIFTHIDCTKNQYGIDDYRKKYSDTFPDKPIDSYTVNNQFHYKIWCIEGGEYSREVWYEMMIVSLSREYQTLLDEILK